MSENQREAFFAETTGLAAEAILVRASNRFGRRVAFASSLGAEDPPSAPGTHVRVHPLLDWTELNIW